MEGDVDEETSDAGAEATINMITTKIQLDWVEEIIAIYTNDQKVSYLMATCLVQGMGQTDYSVIGGIMKSKGRIMVGKSGSTRANILNTIHETSIGGHYGIHTTHPRAQRLFYWKVMKADVEAFIQGCDTCKQCNNESMATPGLLQPLFIPNGPWTHITMDFIEGLPSYMGKSVIWVIVDMLTKYAHSVPLSHPYTATTHADLYLQHIHILHGVPEDIMSDRDVVFQSAFWKEFFKLLGTKLNMSTTHHPQSDGQTERVNRCLETYLRCMIHTNLRQWVKWFLWPNGGTIRATTIASIQAFYGYAPPLLSPGPYLQDVHTSAQALVKDRQ